MTTHFHRDGGELFMTFYCPGCQAGHMVRIGGEASPRWDWNGDRLAPTLVPSVLNSRSETAPGNKDIGRCHLFVTEGRLQYLEDCDHDYAGEVIPLPEIPEEVLA